jgi:dolichol-phosphate mannosyltransferase
MFVIKKKLVIIVPIYNEESCIHELINRLFCLKNKLVNIDTHLTFVNDGSIDKSLELLYKYAKQHKFIKIINFSRNFGHQMAVTAGLDYTEADYAVIIDADLQDPPEVIEEMLKKANEGFDIVYGKRISRKGETIFKKVTAMLFYKFISKMCAIDIPENTGDFRLINRKVLIEIKKLREKHRFIRGMIPWLGFKSTPILYNRDKRYAGNTKYPLKKMLKFALDAIFSFSNKPLRISIHIGLLTCLIGLIGSIFALYLKFYTTLAVPGITSVVLIIIFMSGVQIIMIGILGEYVARIFEESKGRPLYIIENLEN